MVTQSSEEDTPNPIRFTGQYLDSVSDLYDMRAREYDPETGRFLETDPLAADQRDPAVAAYVYVDDQPTVMSDPSGERGMMIVPAYSGGNPVNYIEANGTCSLKLPLTGMKCKTLTFSAYFPDEVVPAAKFRLEYKVSWCWKGKGITIATYLEYPIKEWDYREIDGWVKWRVYSRSKPWESLVVSGITSTYKVIDSVIMKEDIYLASDLNPLDQPQSIIRGDRFVSAWLTTKVYAGGRYSYQPGVKTLRDDRYVQNGQ